MHALLRITQVAIVSETNYEYQIRDSAACAVALLALREAGPKLARAVYNGELLQALCLLYQRSIDPAQRSDLVLPGDVMQLLLGVMAWSPAAKWPEVSKTSWERTLRRCIAVSPCTQVFVFQLHIRREDVHLVRSRRMAK